MVGELFDRKIGDRKLRLRPGGEDDFQVGEDPSARGSGDGGDYGVKAGLGDGTGVYRDAVDSVRGGGPGAQVGAVFHEDRGARVCLRGVASLVGEDELGRIGADGGCSAGVIAAGGGIAAQHPLEAGGEATAIIVERGAGVVQRVLKGAGDPILIAVHRSSIGEIQGDKLLDAAGGVGGVGCIIGIPACRVVVLLGKAGEAGLLSPPVGGKGAEGRVVRGDE